MAPRVAAVVGWTTLGVLAAAATASADGTPQPLPVFEDWTDTSRLSQVNNWSSVPGFIGRRGNQLVTVESVDPQTALAGGDATQISLHPNRNDADSTEVPGVAEFEGADPIVGLHATSLADAPHLVLTLNTTGATHVRVVYDAVDLDGSADDSLSPLALHVRIGGTGLYTNVPEAFIADATVGGANGLRTHVDVILPIGGYPHVNLRWLTTNQAGQDEWIGIDDIAVTASVAPTANGMVGPAPLHAGDVAQALVEVTPGANPPSTHLAVRCDGSVLGESPDSVLHDDGAHGDGEAGDLRFGNQGTIAPGTPAGTYEIPCRVRDAQQRRTDFTIAVVIVPICGDGRIEAGEECDDGGVLGGDGCSAGCAIDPGWACAGAPSACADIDECATGGHDCVDLAACTNSTGSFACTCAAGYVGDGHAGGTGCTDIDECADDLDDCVAGAGCENLAGDFACVCPAGHDGDGHAGGSGCVDVDECATGTAGCAPDASCTNQVGGFACVCDEGFVGDGLVCATVCGDGLVRGEETCDDAGTEPGDGCDEVCAREPGWVCGGEPSACIADRDGDGIEDHLDNCPDRGNGSQSDRDGDGIGDACDDVDDRSDPGGGCRAAPIGAAPWLVLLAFLALYSRSSRTRRAARRRSS